MADEQAGYFKATDGSPLYAVYTPPAPGGKLPVIIAGPLFEERKSAYGCLRRIAERLTAAGHPVLRFDYRGSGESGGSAASRRWPHLLEDLSSARRLMAQLCGRSDSALLGLRLGGTLALQAALQNQAAGVVALAPVIKGAAQVRQWKLRSKIRAELTEAGSADEPRPAGGNAAGSLEESRNAKGLLDFDGYPVVPEFFDDVAALDLFKDPRPLPCPGRLVQISHRDEVSAEYQQLQAQLGSNAKLEVLRLEPFWDKVDDVDTGPLEELVVEAADF